MRQSQQTCPLSNVKLFIHSSLYRTVIIYCVYVLPNYCWQCKLMNYCNESCYCNWPFSVGSQAPYVMTVTNWPLTEVVGPNLRIGAPSWTAVGNKHHLMGIIIPLDMCDRTISTSPRMAWNLKGCPFMPQSRKITPQTGNQFFDIVTI